MRPRKMGHLALSATIACLTIFAAVMTLLALGVHASPEKPASSGKAPELDLSSVDLPKMLLVPKKTVSEPPPLVREVRTVEEMEAVFTQAKMPVLIVYYSPRVPQSVDQLAVVERAAAVYNLEFVQVNIDAGGLKLLHHMGAAGQIGATGVPYLEIHNVKGIGAYSRSGFGSFADDRVLSFWIRQFFTKKRP